MQLIRKILSVVRYRVNKLAEGERLNLKPGQPVPEEKMAEFMNSVDPEEFRDKVLELYGVKIPAGDTAKRCMQRCYIKYCTGPEGRHWNKTIDYEQKVHAEILDKIAKGIKVEKIDIDPLTTKEAVYAVDYSGMPGF